MKGCFSNIIKVVVLTFAIIGFMSLGGWNFVKEQFSKISIFNQSSETLLEKANKIADFSQINQEEYEISRTANVLRYKAVVAEHKASGQKFIVLESKKEPLLQKKDFETGEIDTKIEDLTDKLEKQFIHLQNVQIVKKSSMKGLNQTIPYVKIEADPVNMPPIKHISGIVGVAEKDGKSNLIISVNSDEKYSQIITEQFFKDVK